MAYEHRPGQGSMFNNDYKDTDRHPDMKGQLMTPDGQLWDVAGWWKEGRNGEYLSMSAQEPWQRRRDGTEGGDHRDAATARDDNNRPRGRISEERYQELRRQARSGGQPQRGGSPARGGASGGGYGKTQRPPSARPGDTQETPGHSLPPMDDFSDDEISF